MPAYAGAKLIELRASVDASREPLQEHVNQLYLADVLLEELSELRADRLQAYGKNGQFRLLSGAVLGRKFQTFQQISIKIPKLL